MRSLSGMDCIDISWKLNTVSLNFYLQLSLSKILSCSTSGCAPVLMHGSCVESMSRWQLSRLPEIRSCMPIGLTGITKQVRCLQTSPTYWAPPMALTLLLLQASTPMGLYPLTSTLKDLLEIRWSRLSWVPGAAFLLVQLQIPDHRLNGMRLRVLRLHLFILIRMSCYEWMLNQSQWTRF